MSSAVVPTAIASKTTGLLPSGFSPTSGFKPPDVVEFNDVA